MENDTALRNRLEVLLKEHLELEKKKYLSEDRYLVFKTKLIKNRRRIE